MAEQKNPITDTIGGSVAARQTTSLNPDTVAPGVSMADVKIRPNLVEPFVKVFSGKGKKETDFNSIIAGAIRETDSVVKQLESEGKLDGAGFNQLLGERGKNLELALLDAGADPSKLSGMVGSYSRALAKSDRFVDTMDENNNVLVRDKYTNEVTMTFTEAAAEDAALDAVEQLGPAYKAIYLDGGMHDPVVRDDFRRQYQELDASLLATKKIKNEYDQLNTSQEIRTIEGKNRINTRKSEINQNILTMIQQSSTDANGNTVPSLLDQIAMNKTNPDVVMFRAKEAMRQMYLAPKNRILFDDNGADAVKSFEEAWPDIEKVINFGISAMDPEVQMSREKAIQLATWEYGKYNLANNLSGGFKNNVWIADVAGEAGMDALIFKATKGFMPFGMSVALRGSANPWLREVFAPSYEQIKELMPREDALKEGSPLLNTYAGVSGAMLNLFNDEWDKTAPRIEITDMVTAYNLLADNVNFKTYMKDEKEDLDQLWRQIRTKLNKDVDGNGPQLLKLIEDEVAALQSQGYWSQFFSLGGPTAGTPKENN